MQSFDIYNDIATRTGGDIYIGVVGPVRTGKSTFITKLMEGLIIPNVSGKNNKKVATDEIPQSASGKTIMTTEPKFVPGEAVMVKFDKASARVKLIDCVGYLVEGALGAEEDGKPRLVKTPWQDEEMPFSKAAEFGTKKVINEHSTIGIVVTCDGSFTDIPRSEYKKAEERVINELKCLNKPFIVLFNTQNPSSNEVQKECQELEKKYGVTVVAKNVLNLSKEEIADIISKVLLEFPMRSFDIKLPKWMQALPCENEVVASVIDKALNSSKSICKMKNYVEVENAFSTCDEFEGVSSLSLDMAKGVASFKILATDELFYKVLSLECNEKISDEHALISYVKGLQEAKEEYSKLKNALECSRSQGYGITVPTAIESEISEPEIIKKGGQFCVRVKVLAKSMHLIDTFASVPVDLICGTEAQCQSFVDTLSDENCDRLNVEIFGKPLYMLVNDAISSKCTSISEGVKAKLRKTINRAVNDKKNNLICILI